jgi:hypothetical protein
MNKLIFAIVFAASITCAHAGGTESLFPHATPNSN